MVKKILVTIGLLAGLILVFHNAGAYPYNAGYDSGLHLKYAEIVSREWRIPTFAETRENYNPPLFYLISGLIGKNFSFKFWQYLNVTLALFSLWLWYRVFVKLQPKNKMIPVAAIILVFSWPVFHKTIVMFSLEAFFMLTTALDLWLFINRCQININFKKLLTLSILVTANLMSRMPGLITVVVISAGIIALWLSQKLTFKQVGRYLTVFWLVIGLGSGWFYLGRSRQEVFGVGEGGESEKPFFQRQPIAFYVDVPFTLMMTYPMRQNLPLNKMIPIFYNEFWGDFWNYYPQPRFGLALAEVRKNRELSNPQRIKSLVLQNQINLLPTLLMISGFIYLLLKNMTKKFILVEAMMGLFAVLTWLGFLALLTKYPSWKSDSVKASYMLFVLPIYGFATSLFVFQFLKKYRPLFILSVVILILAAIVNFSWSWY